MKAKLLSWKQNYYHELQFNYHYHESKITCSKTTRKFAKTTKTTSSNQIWQTTDIPRPQEPGIENNPNRQTKHTPSKTNTRAKTNHASYEPQHTRENKTTQ